MFWILTIHLIFAGSGQISVVVPYADHSQCLKMAAEINHRPDLFVFPNQTSPNPKMVEAGCVGL